MILRFIILTTKTALFLGMIGAAILMYIIYHYTKDLPDYSQLKKYYPPSITRMYSADGKLIEEFAREHRIFVPISSVPKALTQAFIAAEDKNFYSHEGIDIFSIFRAAITNISHIINKRRPEGGSTITQQVVKTFLLSPERSFERKIKEAILSYRLSQVFTKDEILELYLNQIFLGKSAYGVASAALNYFNKSIEELTISECAVLASLPKAPSQYNPEKNYKRAVERKNYVIGRMYDDGYLTKEEAKQAIDEPIKLAKFDKALTIDADFYAAKVREEVIEMFGEEYFYTAGLTIMTCVDSKMQKAATNALRFGLKAYDMKRGYRGSLQNIDLKDWQETLKKIPSPYGLLHYKLAVVLDVADTQAKIGLSNGSSAFIYLKDMSWTATNIKSVKKILKPGDVIAAEVIDKKYFLQQIPEINGGIMVIEHETGRVLAAEGGYDFSVSKFDRTTQAKRQPGSLIKPFVYMAALENGAKPTDIFDDSPIDVYQGPGLPIWRPKNDNGKFLGPITLRKGIEKSRNLITVRVGQFAGLGKVAALIRRFGITDSPKVVHSIVLGAIETTLEKMTIAFSIIANGGKGVEPQFIELIKDRKGNVIYKRDYTECPECKSNTALSINNTEAPTIHKTESPVIIDEATNYQMISLLKGSVQRGTASGAKHLPYVIAGKTGTTNKAKDVWFVGFTPKIVVGTYVGYDNPRSLGNSAYGSVYALPVFVHFMTNGYNFPSVDFAVPNSIRLESIDYETGKPSSAPGAIIEALKVNGYNPKISPKNEEAANEPVSPITNMEDLDNSEEIY
ncbi:Penicillin-binding protein 1A [Candidatus Megaera venefica]|uniref:Penicillin-binding protein 1A n=1 Tax=Candidatus Megaera venefica TaxID=2055910 RepID=A0ABU5NC35_9RICK|nr:penicillin-binding protein 1A [Candidatus Megaera venefica]MEA0970707.1 Penicillin-binding protein 1A [Candidatus Megaera venefica]